VRGSGKADGRRTQARRTLVAMRERLRVVALGVLAACGGGDDDGGPTPRAGEPCTAGSAAHCGIAEGNDEKLDAVLACEDGTWTQLLWCGQDEHCHDDGDRGAVVCSKVNDEIVYGEFNGPCDVDAGHACSIDRRYAMVCANAKWIIDTNCSTDVLECTLVEGDCDDPEGCIACQ
jgi:hypothetical protein